MLRYLLHEECNTSIRTSPPFNFSLFFVFVSLTPTITKLVLNKKCEIVNAAALVDKSGRQTIGSKE